LADQKQFLVVDIKKLVADALFLASQDVKAAEIFWALWVPDNVRLTQQEMALSLL
jgi:hypothetical protein